jgi:diacylglycerol kinase family enzyme
VDGRDEAHATELLFVTHNRYQLEELGLHEEVGCLESGRFSIHTTRALGRLALVKLSARAPLGTLEDAPEIVSQCGRELDVRLARRRVRVAVDGEVFVAELPLRFRLRRDALQVIAPAARP